jgi:hypothetical protein
LVPKYSVDGHKLEEKLSLCSHSDKKSWTWMHSCRKWRVSVSPLSAVDVEELVLKG